jgi:hypothetical protein
MIFRIRSAGLICILVLLSSVSIPAQNDPIIYDLEDYSAQNDLQATVENNLLTLQWAGDPGNDIRLKFAVRQGIPTIVEMAIHRVEKGWTVFARNLVPEYRVVSGLRRLTQQQTEPLEKMGVALTEEKLNEIKWDAFWDAPLYVSEEPPKSHLSSIPAAEPFANHPGMPRKEEEITRASIKYNVDSCKVSTNGSRLEVVFSEVELGIFKGKIQFDAFQGSNLIRQMVIAKTEHPSAAFKYDAGLKGFAITSESKLSWRDLAKNWQDNRLGGPPDQGPVIVKSSNRLISAELKEASLSVFPPPHSFYWARESEQNLGYSWYRKDSENSFSFGMRQAELEEDPEFYHNFALYSARPGKWQRMPLFYYISPENNESVIKNVLEFTNGDRFRPLPGFRVMGHHYHVGLVKRLKKEGGFDQRLNDISTMKSVGMDIFSVIDGVRGPGRHDRGELFLKDLEEYYEAARRQSDRGFLVMPNDENSTGGRPPFLGGHYDILFPGPVYWTPGREPDQAFVETHPKYGKVYNIGTPEEMMKMAELENVLISMPHPNTKRSTGYPEAIKDEPQFLHPNYHSLGYRWGMGIDASEKRLGEYRFLNLWNQTNNWMAARNLPPKMAIAISEARSDKGYRGKPPSDDAYGMSPVNYLKIDSVPSVDDMSSIINALKEGDYFITTGEILIPHYEVKKEGDNIKLIAELEWTFPLDFIEVVWGNGEKTSRKVISTTDLLPFGKNSFEISLEGGDKKWLRFAAWDVAQNGALTQPVQLF